MSVSVWVIVVVMIYYNPVPLESYVKPLYCISYRSASYIKKSRSDLRVGSTGKLSLCHYKCFAALKPSQKWYWLRKCFDHSIPGFSFENHSFNQRFSDGQCISVLQFVFWPLGVIWKRSLNIFFTCDVKYLAFDKDILLLLQPNIHYVMWCE